MRSKAPATLGPRAPICWMIAPAPGGEAPQCFVDRRSWLSHRRKPHDAHVLTKYVENRAGLGVAWHEPASHPELLDLDLEAQSGMFPCLRRGRSSRLLCSIIRLRAMIRLVSAGSITSST